MAVIVSDTSPLRALNQLQLVWALGPLYGEVVVPPAVLAELEVTPPGLSPVDLSGYAFISTQAPHDIALVTSLRKRLDPGEAEAIALGVELHADFVLIDEALGRRVAKEHQLMPVGVVGVLVQAKDFGLIPVVAPLLDRLEREIGFRLSPEVRQAGLRLAGEA